MICFNCINEWGCDGCPDYKKDEKMKSYVDGKRDATYDILKYLNDVRLNEDSKGCHECISDLMENIERIGLKNDEGN